MQNKQKGSDISQRIFEVLDKKRIGLSEFARIIDVPQGTVSGWKNRGSAPSADCIQHICANLGVTSEWLLTGEEKPPPNTINSDVNGSAFVQGVNKGSVTVHNGREHTISEEAAELLRLYESMDIKKRIKLLQTAIDLSEKQGE